jgi:hypothetical protein
MDPEKNENYDKANDASSDDAREEDIVKDTDADTRDIEEKQSTETDIVMKSMKALVSMVEDLAAKVDKVSSAQDVITTNARIIDDSIDNSSNDEERMDGVPSLRDFDLSI